MVCAADFRAVTPSLMVWEAYDPSVKAVLSSTAVVADEGLVFIDPIELHPAALARLTLLATPCAIVLTNGNHARAAVTFRDRYDIPICAPADAVAELGIPVDRPFSAGEALPGGWTAIDVSAAGPSEVALIGDGVVCIGDAVINLPSHPFSFLPAKYCADFDRLPNDLRKLLSYDFRILTFAHGDPVAEHARERLHQLLA